MASIDKEKDIKRRQMIIKKKKRKRYMELAEEKKTTSNTKTDTTKRIMLESAKKKTYLYLRFSMSLKCCKCNNFQHLKGSKKNFCSNNLFFLSPTGAT